MEGVQTRTRELIYQLGASHDQALDAEAEKKTREELRRGVLLGPCKRIKDTGQTEVSLVPRRAVWEQHGSATEASVRCIDDMLSGEQNSTVGTLCSHRPTDVDGFLVQSRCVVDRFPQDKVEVFTSDFAKAYKQVTGKPGDVNKYVIGQWSPSSKTVLYYVALSLLFGGPGAPVQFARYPAWFAFVVAVLIARPLSHCVGDVIGVERKATMLSGWRFWRALAEWAGWDVPDSKSPFPSATLIVIGIQPNFQVLPYGEVIIEISKCRVQSLIAQIDGILAQQSCCSGEASPLWGRLGHASTQMWGQFGRARLAPSHWWREHEHGRTNLNVQLTACLHWWRRILPAHEVRAVPRSLQSRGVIITYSDGEGKDAGVGVALWHYDGRPPLAANVRIPR